MRERYEEGLEPKVEQGLDGLSNEQFGQAAFYVHLLADRGIHLDEPYTRQLAGKLRELRFYLGRDRHRITYYIATGRRIVLLTVFRKTRQREAQEIRRADQTIARCIAESHAVEE
jgi:phage-related protein